MSLESTAHTMISYNLLLRMYHEAIDPILITDGELIIAANRAVETTFGYHSSELIGQAIEVLVPEAKRDVHVQHRAGFIDQPYHRPMGVGLVLNGRHKDGHEIPIEINLGVYVEVDGMRVVATIRRVKR
jgi:PAS domain S-box-containing protein